MFRTGLTSDPLPMFRAWLRRHWRLSPAVQQAENSWNPSAKVTAKRHTLHKLLSPFQTDLWHDRTSLDRGRHKINHCTNLQIISPRRNRRSIWRKVTINIINMTNQKNNYPQPPTKESLKPVLQAEISSKVTLPGANFLETRLGRLSEAQLNQASPSGHFLFVG